MKKAVLFFVLVFASAAFAGSSTRTGAAAVCHGRIKVVNHAPDYRVKVVGVGEDLRVRVVNRLGPYSCGEWIWVKHNEDFKVRFVDVGEDFSIRFVDINPGLR